MFIENKLIMDKIIKKDGYVYLVKEHDSYGRHKTITNLGKDLEFWEKKNNDENPKQNKGRTKKDTD